MVVISKQSNEGLTLSSTQIQNKIKVSLASGTVGGFFCTVLCAPLDVAKVRMQIQGSLGINKYSGGAYRVLSLIYREEGIHGIFRGVGPALFTIPLFWGVYWPIYEGMKTYLSSNYSNTFPTPFYHFSSALCAGVIGDIITNPFWVTRTRIQTLALHKEDLALLKKNKLDHSFFNKHFPISTTFGMMRNIYKTEGFGAFYKGITASFLGLSHVAIQFPLYEEFKKLLRQYNNHQEESVYDLVLASVGAKIIASSITYPHEVLRSRLQDSRKIIVDGKPVNQGLVGTFKSIVEKEGFFSLWSGLKVNLIRIIPATITTFVTYEYTSRYFTKKFQS